MTYYIYFFIFRILIFLIYILVILYPNYEFLTSSNFSRIPNSLLCFPTSYILENIVRNVVVNLNNLNHRFGENGSPLKNNMERIVIAFFFLININSIEEDLETRASRTEVHIIKIDKYS
jgi:hypothetical protein